MAVVISNAMIWWKATIAPGRGAVALAPTLVAAADAEVCVVTSAGQLLCLAIEELPVLAKGKGNKLIALKGDESVVAVQAIAAEATLLLYSGKRHMALKSGERDPYRGPRASRGRKLPRGYTQVQALAVAAGKPAS